MKRGGLEGWICHFLHFSALWGKHIHKIRGKSQAPSRQKLPPLKQHNLTDVRAPWMHRSALGCVTGSASHMFQRLYPCLRGQTRQSQDGASVWAGTVYDTESHMAQSLISASLAAIRVWALKSDPTFSLIQSPPIHYKSFYQPRSLATSSRQNSWSAYLYQTWEYKLITPHGRGLMSVTGLLFVCCCITSSERWWWQ